MIPLWDSHLTDGKTKGSRSLYEGASGGLVHFHEFCELVNFTMVA